MNNIAWGPTRTWSWNGLKKDEGYYNKYKLEYWDKSRRTRNRWGFQIHGTGSEASNPFIAIYRAFRFRRRHDAEIRAYHNRPGPTSEQFEQAVKKLNDANRI